MVQQMFKRLFQWLKSLFQGWFSRKYTPLTVGENVQQPPAPPLTDTDLEFLFTELLEGVHQARGQTWAVQWLSKIEHRIPTERWIQWLKRFGERLLASPSPNNELAARLVQLGELDIGEVGNVAYDIGMQVLTRNQGEPIWEYDGPDSDSTIIPQSPTFPPPEAPEEGEYQTVTLDQLLIMLHQDENLCQQLAQQLALETDDPELIIQTLINQYHAENPSATE